MHVLTSKLLGVPHGFSTREGGVSVGDFTSLNCSRTVGDDPAAVAANLERLAASARVRSSAALRTVTQVHGAVVVRAEDSTEATEADAVWTQTEGVAVGVRTADCVPILLEDPVGRRVAAVHAGWRGVISNIVVKTLETLVGQGSRLADVRVAIGPCIQACCFEVDGDLPARFENAFGPAVVRAVPGKAKRHLDLSGALVQALTIAGLSANQVDRLTACTSCEARFFSHRRDHGHTGRQLSFITCAPR